MIDCLDHYKIVFSKNKLVLNRTGIVRLLTFMTGLVLSDYLLYMKWIVPMRSFCCEWPTRDPDPISDPSLSSISTTLHREPSSTTTLHEHAASLQPFQLKITLSNVKFVCWVFSTIPEPLIKVTKRNAGPVLRFMESTMQISISRSEVQPGGIKKKPEKLKHEIATWSILSSPLTDCALSRQPVDTDSHREQSEKISIYDH
jgi:hypothetical protein